MDLTTQYLGLNLKNPLVPSASPLSENLDNIYKMEDAGAAAVVFYSLFEEQITKHSQSLDHFLEYGTESFPEALDYIPELESYDVGPDSYLQLLSRAKAAVDIPIIGSLNGVSPGGWVTYARNIEEAGADALELNIYHIPTDIKMTGAEVEQMYLDVVKNVKANVTIPVAVKVSPYFSATANMMYQLTQAGADGLVLFNRFYQPDFDLDKLDVVPNLILSDAHELRLPLRWVSLLYGQVEADLAITSGVHSHIEVLKGMMAGAKVTMLASELLRHGIGRMGDILTDLMLWMEENEYESIAQMQGSLSRNKSANPDAFERANYVRVLHSWRPDPTGYDSQPKLQPA